MSIFKWLERKFFTGEILKNYGNLQDERMGGIVRLRATGLLCRRKGKLKMVFRHVGTSPLSASVQYTSIDVSPQTLQALAEMISDARRHLESEATGQPPVIARRP